MKETKTASHVIAESARTELSYIQRQSKWQTLRLQTDLEIDPIAR